MLHVSARSSLALFLFVSIGATIASCRSPDRASQEARGSSQLTLLKFSNDVDGTVSAHFVGDQSAGHPSFDGVPFTGIARGQSQMATTFLLDGKPAQPRPTQIVVGVATDTARCSCIVHAADNRFIVSVDATLLDGTTLTVIALQDDGTPAKVTK